MGKHEDNDEKWKSEDEMEDKKHEKRGPKWTIVMEKLGK